MTDDMPNLDLSAIKGTEETKNLAAIMYAKGRRDLVREVMERVDGLGKVHPLVALRAAHLYFCANAEEKWYGSFQGGDPRLFCPDPECSTEEDRANHKAACEASSLTPLPACLPLGHASPHALGIIARRGRR